MGEESARFDMFAYRTKNPYARRLGPEQLDSSPNGTGKAIFSFADSGARVFGHEEAVVLAGDTVLPSTRAALAAVLLDWRNNGGAPTVLVFAPTLPLELAGFDCVLCPLRLFSEWIGGSRRIVMGNLASPGTLVKRHRGA